MPSARLAFLLPLTILAFLLGSPAGATHLAYSYSVDRFVVDRAGSGDFTDEFNNGSLSPWVTIWGTASESGGFAHLTNPGTDFPSSENSQILLSGQDLVGGGDFTVTSEWSAVLPATNQAFSLNVQEISSPGPFPLRNNIFGIANLPSLGGLIAFIQILDDTSPVAGNETLVFVVFSPLVGTLNSSSNIVLRASFDDASEDVTFAYRIDGTNFVTPFDPISVSSEFAQFALEAVAVPEPSILHLLAASFASLLATRRLRA